MNINEEAEYKIALSEVDDILYFTDEEIVDKIPKDFINFIKENKDSNYITNINPYVSLEEQEISDKARSIIALIYRSYISTEDENKLFQKKDKNEFEKIEKEKREKFDPDDIFNFKESEEKVNSDNKINTQNEDIEKSLNVVKKNIFEKILIKIKNFLKINKSN